MKAKDATDLILLELGMAEESHPGWPEDIIHAAAIMIEEAGETMQAANDCEYNPQYRKTNIARLKTEAAQTAAMCMRILMNLPDQCPLCGAFCPPDAAECPECDAVWD